MSTVCTPCQATTMLIHLKNGTYLQITFMKYDKYCPRILGDKAQNTLFHIFFLQSRAKRHNTPKIYCSMYDNLGKSFSKYESHP